MNKNKIRMDIKNYYVYNIYTIYYELIIQKNSI